MSRHVPAAGTQPTPARRRVLATAVLAPLALTSLSLAAVPAQADPAQPAVAAKATPASSGTGQRLLTEDFEAPLKDTGWSVDNTDVAGMKEGWQGWGLHTLDQVTDAWGEDGNRGEFSRGEGDMAVVASDANRPTAETFSSALVSPKTDIPKGTGALSVSFDSHYRQGQAPQTARLMADFDGTTVVAKTFTGDGLDARVDANVDVPKGAKQVQFRWEYNDSSNNWYWMIDNVDVETAAPQPRTIGFKDGTKPVAAPKETLTLNLTGLRQGTRVKAAFDDARVGSKATSAKADASGNTQLKVRLKAGAGLGQHALKLSGDGVKERTVSVTVLPSVDADKQPSTEPVVASSNFETGRVPASQRPWSYSTVPEVYQNYGLKRRQAFTRADGRVAHIDAEASAAQATLTTGSLKLPAQAKGLELRFDSHYLAGKQDSTATVTLDYGSKGKRTVKPFDAATSHESSQVRIPLDVPQGARHVKVGFSFSAPAGGGNWSVDNLALVQALPALADDAKPSDVVDIISDIQGDNPNAVMQKTVLPGLSSLAPKASTLVANGDLVNSGDESAYQHYFDALDSSGAKYSNVISTMGNHEYYGDKGPVYYKDLWLRLSRMSNVGGQGGLWGEQVLPGGVPVLWIGSEGYDYNEHHGNGPFVTMSDRQFNWLESRLDYYRKAGQPVLLFSHHPFPNTVSGTYAEFYSDDYGDDAARMTRLLSQNPNVSLFTAHTHWDVRDPDWDGALRDNPATVAAPSVFNTGSITTAYGPSGDWGDTGKNSGNPVALRAYVYDDRVRVVAYEFVDGKPKELKHKDVPLPAQS